MPGTSSFRVSGPALTAMRTGMRWTILVKLPVAFCGGRTENWAPVPGAMLATRPGSSTPGSARSEEHTSELQSLMRISYAVFCLKKKKETTLVTTNKLTQQDRI